MKINFKVFMKTKTKKLHLFFNSWTIQKIAVQLLVKRSNINVA